MYFGNYSLSVWGRPWSRPRASVPGALTELSWEPRTRGCSQALRLSQKAEVTLNGFIHVKPLQGLSAWSENSPIRYSKTLKLYKAVLTALGCGRSHGAPPGLPAASKGSQSCSGDSTLCILLPGVCPTLGTCPPCPASQSCPAKKSWRHIHVARGPQPVSLGMSYSEKQGGE